MDTHVTLSRLADRFLAEAEDDLVGLWEIAREVGEGGADPASVMQDSLVLVRELLSHGLQAGDPPYSEHGYRPWPDQDPDSVIERIRREWIALGRTPNIPDIAWFGLPRHQD